MSIRSKDAIGKLLRRFSVLLPVAAAAAVVAVFIRTRSGPEEQAVHERTRPMRVIEVPFVDLVPRTTGYGIAEPGRIWRAIAQVKGTTVFVSPQLHPGMFVEEGAVLLEINPADYELAVARLESSIAEASAKLEELAAEDRSKKVSLSIEKESLTLAEKSLERLRTLFEEDAVPQDQVDREARNVLLQKQAIQQLENAINMIPARRKALDAAIAVHQANIEQAKIDLERTKITAPFDARIGEVAIETGQYLNPGQPLFEAQGIDSIEIEAKFLPEQLQSLLTPDKMQRFQAGMSMSALRDLFDLEVVIHVQSGDWEATWPARFERIRESVDPRIRAMNVVAVVENPYEKIVPGIRPALIQGTYCMVELRAPTRPDVAILPRHALQSGQVFVLDSEQRLRSRNVVVSFVQDDFVAVSDGLGKREMIVVSDPIPAIEGMQIEPVFDAEVRDRIVRQAEAAEVSR
jgi:RND family efflux transporter MFP subunit